MKLTISFPNLDDIIQKEVQIIELQSPALKGKCFEVFKKNYTEVNLYFFTCIKKKSNPEENGLIHMYTMQVT